MVLSWSAQIPVVMCLYIASLFRRRQISLTTKAMSCQVCFSQSVSNVIWAAMLSFDAVSGRSIGHIPVDHRVSDPKLTQILLSTLFKKQKSGRRKKTFAPFLMGYLEVGNDDLISQLPYIQTI